MATQRSAVDSTPPRRKQGEEESSQLARQRTEGPEDFARPPEFADDALALEFTQEYRNDLRYTAALGRWTTWNGMRWERDDTCYVFDLVRRSCRRVSSKCYEDRKLPRRIASAATVSAVERLARADRHHAATVNQWDADPWMLNTPAGLVDLRTGVLRAATREDYCTKITTAAPGRGCPLWLEFLSRVTDHNEELLQFLQRMCGYILTGITREHAWFFHYGTGANGKSVFINTISGVMGDYAKTAPIETFTECTYEHHPTDLAGLQGARLVTAIETEDGRCWAESKIKRLTAGDPIAARFMRQDFFEYVPQFKLVIAGNHKPGLRSNDEATRRRLHLVPFTVTIPQEERDKELIEKLRAERDGILQWAIDGCVAWRRQGLNPPMIVRDATEEYIAAEDRIGQWLTECCDIGSNYLSTVAALFGSWREWSIQDGEKEGSQKRFSQNLEARGFIRERSS